MDEDTATLKVEHLQSWRLGELRRIGFPLQQRAALLERIELGELELEQVRHLVDDLDWTPEQAWLVVR